ncbi:MAG: hypothetical protein JJT94_13815 [Bernardetiaceae bacterium]|nr:hypothetical protein [Bernardetiaceae bacterium]
MKSDNEHKDQEKPLNEDASGELQSQNDEQDAMPLPKDKIEDLEVHNLDTNSVLQTTETMNKSKQNLLLGIVGGVIAMIIGVVLWAESSLWVSEHRYAYMSILLGLLVGLGVRFLGKGHSVNFGIVAVLLVIIGSFVGNIFSALAPIADAFGMNYLEIMTSFDFQYLLGFLQDRFVYPDIAFYALAIFFAYRFSFKKRKFFFSPTANSGHLRTA